MKSKILLSLFLLSFYGCKYACKGKNIPLGLMFAHKGDKLTVYIEDKFLLQKDFEKLYKGHFLCKTDRLSEICTEKDSIKVRVVFNVKDTTFYIYPKEINEFYIANTYVPNRIVIFYNYVDGGFREYDPIR